MTCTLCTAFIGILKATAFFIDWIIDKTQLTVKVHNQYNYICVRMYVNTIYVYV